ncbi:hypothetical protein [Acidisoma silvae]|uniref:Uncharacterized protein n=1 Tax=Acidisoma silvae TaxID=2802396 RepID=A0A963YVI3_9PROT|nr:hypothetical protein [Acidisoma silvae]MCB8877175.1 hypothetical protein [Acidisoma silvae]
MSRSRSPNYPQLSLKDAVNRVTDVYKSDCQTELPRDLVAERLGYSGLNGKSLAVLGALGKYGLMEGRGDALRVSDLALRIIAHPPGSPERAAALSDAATRPDLFRDLDQRFSGGRGSDAAIRAFLLTQGFIPPAAETALRAWRDTQAMLGAETLIGPPETEPELPPKPDEIGLRRAVFGLAEGEVVITAPVFLSPESVNDLQDYLDVFMKRARREAGLA